MDARGARESLDVHEEVAVSADAVVTLGVPPKVLLASRPQFYLFDTLVFLARRGLYDLGLDR